MADRATSRPWTEQEGLALLVVNIQLLLIIFKMLSYAKLSLSTAKMTIGRSSLPQSLEDPTRLAERSVISVSCPISVPSTPFCPALAAFLATECQEISLDSRRR